MKVALLYVSLFVVSCNCFFSVYAAQAAQQHQKEVSELEIKMIEAARMGTLTEEGVKNYIKQGADINAKNSHGDTVLILLATGYTACFGSFHEICLSLGKLVIDNHADLNAHTVSGYTALMLAVRHQNTKGTGFIELLLSAGADPNLSNKERAYEPINYHTEAYERLVQACRKKRQLYFARQEEAKKIIAEEPQLIPVLANLIVAYAYGPLPTDLPMETGEASRVTNSEVQVPQLTQVISAPLQIASQGSPLPDMAPEKLEQQKPQSKPKKSCCILQ